MTYQIRPARRSEAKPLIGLYAESGCGKTFSSLLLARGFIGDKGRLVQIETEAGRGEAFVDLIPGGYDVISMRGNFSPEEYGKAIVAAEQAKADAVIIDSASHEWESDGGVLSMAADNQADGKKGPLVWQRPKQLHKRHFMLRLLATPIPLVIVCMRAKFPMREITKDGRKEWVRSDQLEPIQADDILFEMFVHGWIDHLHRFRGTKYTRPDLQKVIPDGEIITLETGRAISQWAGGANAPAQAASVASARQAPAEAATLSMTELDEKLAEAAEHGMLRLQHVWGGLSAPDKKILKASLDRRHKPRAEQVDAGKTETETALPF